MSVLKLSTAWNFEAIRQTAIEELATYGETDPILRLIVAKRFDVLHWFVPAVNALARREAPLGSEDYDRLEVLGKPQAIFKFMLKIAQVRESLPSGSPINMNCVFNTNYNVTCSTHSTYGTPRFCNIVAEQVKGNPGDRSSFDFTEAIQKIFDCKPDPKTSGAGSLVPNPSYWELS